MQRRCCILDTAVNGSYCRSYKLNIQMLATEVTENTEVFSFVGAASAANSSRSDGLFAAKAAPTFTVVQIKTTK